MKVVCRIALALAIMTASGPSIANYACSGTIQTFGVSSNGEINVNLGPGVWVLCSVQSDGNYGGISISAGTCKSWQAQLLAAKHAGASVALFIVHATVTGLDPSLCGSHGSWVAPGIYYIESNPS